MNTRHANQIEKTFRIVYVDNLPADHELKSPPPGGPFVKDVLENGIIQPIGLNYVSEEETYEVVYGRRRIKAARLAVAKAKKDKKEMVSAIPAMVAIDLTEEEKALWAMLENAHGSDNPLSDVRAIRQLLIAGMDYTEIAKAIHKPKSYVINTDQKYGNLNKRFITGLEEGRIAPGIAARISKQTPGVQEKLVEKLADNGKLTGPMIEEVRVEQQEEILGTIELPDMQLPEVEKHTITVTISQWDLDQVGVKGHSPLSVGWRFEQIFQEKYFRKILEEAVEEIEHAPVG